MEVRREEPSEARALTAGRPASASPGAPALGRLADLSLGQTARVHSIAGDAVLADRLAELGLCPGTEVRLERRAPLGDPLIFFFRGTRLALRSREARHVCVLRGEATT